MTKKIKHAQITINCTTMTQKILHNQRDIESHRGHWEYMECGVHERQHTPRPRQHSRCAPHSGLSQQVWVGGRVWRRASRPRPTTTQVIRKSSRAALAEYDAIVMMALTASFSLSFSCRIRHKKQQQQKTKTMGN